MQESVGYRGPEPTSRREYEVGEIDRAFARFEDRVVSLSKLSHEQARLATAFVLHALEYRMDDGLIKWFENSLPPGVGVLLQRVKTSEDDFTGFNRATFFKDIARHLAMPTEKVGGVVAGVLTGVREWMDPAEAAAFAKALPDDMQALWRHPSRKFKNKQATPNQIARHEAHYRQAFQGLVRDIKLFGNLSADLAECAAVAVMCQLDARLMGEGPDLKAQLPKHLQELLLDCNKPIARPDKFNIDEFYARVATDLDLADSNEAIPIVAAVFNVVRNHISEGEAKQVTHQLPKDIAGVWACA